VKKLGIGLIVVIGLIALGFYWVTSNLDGIVKQMVETYGSEATGTKVTLEGVEIDLVGGTVALTGLTVANPEGYAAEHAFSLATISVSVDPQTLAEDVIVVKEVIIDKPEVTYELKGTKSNLDEIKDNVSGGGSSGDGEAEEYSGPKFIIDKVQFTGGTVNVSTDGIVQEDMSTELEAFTLRDIGKSKGGVTPQEIATEMTAALTGSALKAVTKEGVKGVLDKAGDKIKGLFGK
jgi:uncharacterized protein involved in outer membrane biogenesis